MFTTHELFDAGQVESPLRALLDTEYPWQILALLDDFVDQVTDERQGNIHPTAVLEGAVYLAPDAVIGPHAFVRGPVWIGEGAELGHGATVRDGAVIGAHAKVGHCSEVKRSLLLPGAKVPHFNYVGDAVIGLDVNLGAGVKLANFKPHGAEVKVDGLPTGLRKFSAAVGDGVFIGCNAVLAPGTVIGQNCIIYNGVMVRGVIAANTIVKLRQEIAPVPQQPSLALS